MEKTERTVRQARVRGNLTSVGLAALAAASILTGCATTKIGGYGSAYTQEKSAVGEYLKGRFAATQKQLSDAAASFGDAASAVPHDTDLIRNAFFYELASGQIDDAVPFAEKLLLPEYQAKAEEQPKPGQSATHSFSLPLLAVAADRIASKDPEGARTVLEQGGDTRFADSIIYLLDAWATFEVDGLDAGIAILEQDRPKLFTGFSPLHAALMYDIAGETEKAREAYEQGLSSYGNDMLVLAYGNFLERQMRSDQDARDQAIDLYTKLHEQNGVLRRAGILGLERLGEPLAVSTGKQRSHKSRPARKRFVSNAREGAALVFYNFAWASYEQIMSDYAAASRAGLRQLEPSLNTPLAFSQLSLHLNEDFAPSQYVVGAAYASYGLPKEAIETYSNITRESVFFEFAVMDMAEAWLALEKPEEAISLLNNRIEADGLSPQTALTLADVLTTEERYEEADIALTNAISLVENGVEEGSEDRDLWRYYFSRGAMRMEADRWDDAERDLKRAVELSPDQPYVLNYLGYSWAERGVNLDEAFEMIEKALQMRPTSGAIMDSLGWAHYQLGRYEKAAQYLERAVRLEPADPVITDHLGDAYWQTGRPIEARYEWRRALSYEPDAELVETIRGKLANGLSDEQAVPSAD